MSVLKTLKAACWLFLLVVAVPLAAEAQQRPAKPVIAIRDFLPGKNVSVQNMNMVQFRKVLEESLRNTRKFTLVTRDKGAMSILQDEQALSASGLTTGNAAFMGQLEAANFIVVPTVLHFKHTPVAVKIPNIANKYRSHEEGEIQISFQILDSTTAEVKTAFRADAAVQTPQSITNRRPHNVSNSVQSALFDQVAAIFSNQLIDYVFPMVIIKASQTQVIINRGKDGGLKKGELLDVFEPGEEVIDPYTGESLGSAEMLIGEVKVVRINPKFTIAVPSEGGVPFASGQIVRKKN